VFGVAECLLKEQIPDEPLDFASVSDMLLGGEAAAAAAGGGLRISIDGLLTSSY